MLDHIFVYTYGIYKHIDVIDYTYLSVHMEFTNT